MDAQTLYRTTQDLNHVADLYDDWKWLLDTVHIETVRAQSLFGDLLFSDATNSYLLDTIEGKLLTLTDWQPPLQDVEWREQYFMTSLVQEMIQQGTYIKPSELFCFQTPPILGGAFEVDNMTVLSDTVVLSLMGQLHRQVKDLPAGAKISGFKLQ